MASREYFAIVTLAISRTLPGGSTALHNSTITGTFTPRPEVSRQDIYWDLCRQALVQAGFPAEGTPFSVLHFSCEPNQL